MCDGRLTLEHLRNRNGRIICTDCLGLLSAQQSLPSNGPPPRTPKNWRVHCRRVRGEGEPTLSLILEAKDRVEVVERLGREYPSWQMVAIEPAPQARFGGLRFVVCLAGLLLCLFALVNWVAGRVGIDLTGIRWLGGAAFLTGAVMFWLASAGTELANPVLADSEK